jgi:RNA polymerase sigma-70 factor (ECF subfamily)
MAVRDLVSEAELEAHRRELTGYCYRMLGSGFEAEDAVQETLLRAWRRADGFEGRSSVRTWLFRIATNVCLDMRDQPQRRALPMEMGPASPPVEALLGPPLAEVTWITPIADGAVEPVHADPAELAEHRETVRLAFVAALQHLPARQRAALILCDVLRWHAAETADLLDTSVAAVNSSLQRARATLKALPDGTLTSSGGTSAGTPALSASGGGRLDLHHKALLGRYVELFERYDIEGLVGLLHADAVQSMPPFAMWIRGAADIGRWMLEPGPSACRGSRLLRTTANGCPAFGQYKPDGMGGWSPWALQVLEIADSEIVGAHYFLSLLDPERLFPAFGLPVRIDG